MDSHQIQYWWSNRSNSLKDLSIEPGETSRQKWFRWAKIKSTELKRKMCVQKVFPCDKWKQEHTQLR